MIETLFKYSIAVSITLAAAWLSYRAALGNDRRFKVDRTIVLVLYMGALLMLPLTMLLPMPKALFVFGGEAVREPSGINFTTLSVVWVAGVAVTLSLTLAEMLRIALIIIKARKENTGGYRVYVTSDKRGAPFSIGKAIVIDEADFADSRGMAVVHELGHVTHRHTLDLVIAQTVAIFCWYNPAAWLLRRDLKSIHEFQADAYVISSGCDTRDYQLFLISRTAGMRWPGITNWLNSCDLGKRLKMMNATVRSKRLALLRYAMPAVGLSLAFGALCVPEIRTAVIPVYNITDDDSRSERKLDLDVFVNGDYYPETKINDIPVNEIKSITINKTDNRMEIETR